jgi:hypothetical protein
MQFIEPPSMRWGRSLGGDWGELSRRILEVNDGGFIFIGVTTSFSVGGADGWLVQTGVDGIPLWTRSYGGRDADVFYDFVQTTNRDYVIVGRTRSFGSAEQNVWLPWLLRTNQTGHHLWNKTYGSSGTNTELDLSITSSGGFAILAIVNGEGMLIFTDDNGNQLWNVTYPAVTAVSSLIVLNEGGYAFLSYPSTLVRVDTSGTLLWNKTFLSSEAKLEEVIQTQDGGLAIIGYSESEPADVVLLRADTSGNLLWSKTYGNTALDEFGKSLIEMTSGNLALLGNRYTNGTFSNTQSDFYLICTQSDGTLLWEQIYYLTQEIETFEHPMDVIETTDGGFALLGHGGHAYMEWGGVYLIRLNAPTTQTLPELDYQQAIILLISGCGLVAILTLVIYFFKKKKHQDD